MKLFKDTTNSLLFIFNLISGVDNFILSYTIFNASSSVMPLATSSLTTSSLVTSEVSKSFVSLLCYN